MPHIGQAPPGDKPLYQISVSETLVTLAGDSQERQDLIELNRCAVCTYASGQGRLPEAADIAESDRIFGGLRVGSVHECSCGHDFDQATT